MIIGKCPFVGAVVTPLFDRLLLFIANEQCNALTLVSIGDNGGPHRTFFVSTIFYVIQLTLAIVGMTLTP
jgi:putative exporter of polyketide antibiotics